MRPWLHTRGRKPATDILEGLSLQQREALLAARRGPLVYIGGLWKSQALTSEHATTTIFSLIEREWMRRQAGALVALTPRGFAAVREIDRRAKIRAELLAGRRPVFAS